MSQSIETLPQVEAVLNYLAPMADRPRNYTYEPPAGVPRSNIVTDTHIVPVHSARPIAADVSLDREGFALLHQRSAVRDFYDDEEVRRVYYPEAAQVLAEATGARRVFVFDHTVRRRVPGVEDRAAGALRQPVPRVHVDHTVTSGPQRVRDLLGDEAEELLRGRFEVVNLWRPIRGPLRDAPLAVCDARTVAAEDLVPSDLVYRDRVGETYAVRFNPQHRWFYVPEMQADEALLLKCYEFRDGRACAVRSTHGIPRPDRRHGRGAAREYRTADLRVSLTKFAILLGVIEQRREFGRMPVQRIARCTGSFRPLPSAPGRFAQGHRGGLLLVLVPPAGLLSVRQQH